MKWIVTLWTGLFLLVACPVFADGKRTVVVRGGIQPQVAIGADGRIYVVYLKQGNVEVAISTDRGASFKNRVLAIDAHGKGRGGYQRGPHIGVDGDGNVHITAPLCFDADELKKRHPAAELWYAISRDGGKTWAKPLQVNEVAKKAAEGLHWLAVAPNGEACVVWLDARDGGGQAIYYSSIHNGKVKKNRRLAGPVCECCAPGLAVDGKGNPLLVFREGGGRENRSTFLMRSKDGGNSWKKAGRLNRKTSNVHG